MGVCTDLVLLVELANSVSLDRIHAAPWLSAFIVLASFLFRRSYQGNQKVSLRIFVTPPTRYLVRVAATMKE